MGGNVRRAAASAQNRRNTPYKSTGSVRQYTSVLLQLAISHWQRAQQNSAEPIGFHRVKVVGLEGFEPPTHGLGNRWE